MQISNKFSALASDPLRGFRFYAEFVGADNDQTTFSNKIKSDRPKGNNVTGIAPGYSNGFVGGFTQIGGLQVQVQEIAYREGGYNTTAHKLPGLVTFTPVVFQRGVLFGNDQGMTWLRGLIEVARGSGINGNSTGPAGNFRVNINIYAVDHPNTSTTMVPRIGWKLHNAWITSLTYTDLNSVSNEVMFETMTVTHEGLEVFFVDPVTKGKVTTPPASSTPPINGGIR